MIDRHFKRLHQTFCQITGFEPKYAIYERSWADYVTKGFTEADLRCVLLFLIGENRRNTFSYSLRLGKLLDFQYHHFADLLAEAQAKHRNRRSPKTARESVLNSFRPAVVEPVVGMAKSVKEILAEMSK